MVADQVDGNGSNPPPQCTLTMDMQKHGYRMIKNKRSSISGNEKRKTMGK